MTAVVLHFGGTERTGHGTEGRSTGQRLSMTGAVRGGTGQGDGRKGALGCEGAGRRNGIAK